MFGCNKRLRAIEEELYKKEEYMVGFHGGRYEISTAGILERLDRLEAENKKLKAVVAELCDYVYSELEISDREPTEGNIFLESDGAQWYVQGLANGGPKNSGKKKKK